MQRCSNLADRSDNVTVVRDIPTGSVIALLRRYGLELIMQPDGSPITGSYWGGSEAGIIGRTVYARRDTPIHSILHEACHIICMSSERRGRLERDAGGDDLEEAAVCYLQVVLADELGGVGRERLMRDMDEWGYSFRLGSTASWFENDADDARKWLIDREVLLEDGTPTFRLRT